MSRQRPSLAWSAASYGPSSVTMRLLIWRCAARSPGPEYAAWESQFRKVVNRPFWQLGLRLSAR